jgi:hypothetical protein
MDYMMKYISAARTIKLERIGRKPGIDVKLPIQTNNLAELYRYLVLTPELKGMEDID